MSRVTVILTGREVRERVCRWVMSAPVNTRVELKESKRSIPQNDRMHAMLTDIAVQASWHGVKLAKDDWKLIFLEALWRSRGETLRLVPNLDGTGFVALDARSSSDLSKDEMTDLIELMFHFGAQRAIQFHEDGKGASGANNPARDAA